MGICAPQWSACPWAKLVIHWASHKPWEQTPSKHICSSPNCIVNSMLIVDTKWYYINKSNQMISNLNDILNDVSTCFKSMPERSIVKHKTTGHVHCSSHCVYCFKSWITFSNPAGSMGYEFGIFADPWISLIFTRHTKKSRATIQCGNFLWGS